MEAIARNAVLVRIHGPDPKGTKRNDQSFSLFDAGITTLSASGTVVELGGKLVVLTTAHALRPFLTDANKCAHLLLPAAAQFTPLVLIIRRSAWNMLAPSKNSDSVAAEDELEMITGSLVEVMIAGKEVTDSPEWCRASVLAIGGGGVVSSGLATLLNPWDGWSVGGTAIRMRSVRDFENGDPCDFAVLELTGGDGPLRKAWAGMPWRDTFNLRQGEPVAVLASPFGALSPSIFLNSISTGVVSNFVTSDKTSTGSDVALVLTDARCLPCTEGGPVVDGNGQLLGLALPPLQQRNGQTVGYGLVAPIACIQPFLADCASYKHGRPQQQPEISVSRRLGVVKMLPAAGVASSMLPASSAEPEAILPSTRTDGALLDDDNSILPPYIALDLPTDLLERAGRSLAMVCVGSSWASGILVSASGHILTNAHVFHTGSSAKSAASRDKKNYPSVFVWIQLAGEGGFQEGVAVEPVECKATIIYKSDGPLDVALLQARLPEDGRRNRFVQPINLDASFAALAGLQPGEPVAAYGHALYGTHFKQRRPSFSVGNLSKIVRLNGLPAMLQSSAAVHGGNR